MLHGRDDSMMMGKYPGMMLMMMMMMMLGQYIRGFVITFDRQQAWPFRQRVRLWFFSQQERQRACWQAWPACRR